MLGRNPNRGRIPVLAAHWASPQLVHRDSVLGRRAVGTEARAFAWSGYSGGRAQVSPCFGVFRGHQVQVTVSLVWLSP